MNTQERINIIEKAGYKINNNEIIDIITKEQLKLCEQDRLFYRKYKSNDSEIYIRSNNKITIKRNNLEIKVKETQDEQIVKIKNKNNQLIITTTIEGMMYKVGSIKIIGIINNEIIKKEYIQRIEKAEINNKIINLQEVSSKLISDILMQNIRFEKYEIIKDIIEENIKKIIKVLNENINRYIKGVQLEKDTEKIKILEKYKKKL